MSAHTGVSNRLSAAEYERLCREVRAEYSRERQWFAIRLLISDF